MKRIIALVVIVSMLLISGGCKASGGADVMVDVESNEVETVDLSQGNAAVADFGIRLFQNSIEEDENTLISPLSVLCALAMTANGADGETLAQMEEVLGVDSTTLNSWVYSYMKQLPEGDNYKLRMANSIWLRDADLNINQDFLQINADYYNAGVYKEPFNSSTCKAINKWVKKNTDGMIENILDEIPKEAVMYLVNALAFDAKWQEIYTENQIKDDIFTKEDGTKQDVEMMHSTENLYLEDEKATGFIKYYEDEKYAFVALLPKKGVSVSDYVSELSGTHVREMLEEATFVNVYAGIPKFESEYSVKMSDILISMGMRDAFEPGVADFSQLADLENLCIGEVKHKTFISVDERGTKAGAATMVEIKCGSAMPDDEKTVKLDRPFVYMLVNCENNMPFFIGTMMDVGK